MPDFVSVKIKIPRAMKDEGAAERVMKEAFTTAVVECSELVRENFAKLDMARSRHGSHFYEQKGVDSTSYRVSPGGERGQVVVNSREMAHKLRGGKVVPVRVKYLALPLADKYFGKPPRAYGRGKGSPLQFRRTKSGAALLYDVRENKNVPAIRGRGNVFVFAGTRPRQRETKLPVTL